jgi:uncharacterized repeat protein (TIGR01451 family)
VRKPDGTTLTNFSISYGNGFLDATTLLVTGTYVVNVQPTTTGVTSLTLYPVTDLALATTEGGNPLAVTTAIPGQNAAILFGGTAGDSPTLIVSAPAYASCNGTVYRPDGSASASFNCASTNSTLLGTLNETGTYKILIDPQGAATGSVSLQLALPSSGGKLSVTMSHAGSFYQGQSGAQYAVTVSNIGAGPTSGTVSVTEMVPTGMSLTAMTGTGWTCPLGGAICSRSDPLAAGMSYQTISVTVSVGSGVGSQLNNQVSVSGGGSVSAGASDATTISAFSPCDFDQNGSVSVADVQLIINRALGVNSPKDLNGDGVANVVDVQIVINAALGFSCSAN